MLFVSTSTNLCPASPAPVIGSEMAITNNTQTSSAAPSKAADSSVPVSTASSSMNNVATPETNYNSKKKNEYDRKMGKRKMELELEIKKLEVRSESGKEKIGNKTEGKSCKI